MRLSQGDQTLDLMWIGGEPIENEGDQGTRSLPLWTNGEFVVEQRIPDWKGRLTQSIDLTGSLRAGQISAIYKLCADNQLSADVELLRSTGEVAQVRFTLGKAESAVIAGQSESAIAAMSKLNAWTDGTFRIVMRPAFGDEKAAEAPVFKPQGGAQFDVTGNLDLAKGQSDWPGGAAVPPKSNPTGSNPPKAAGASGAAAAIPPRLAQTLIKAPAPAGLIQQASAGSAPAGLASSSSAPTVPMTSVSKEQIADAKRASKSGNTTLVIVSVLVIVLCLGGIAAAVLLR